MTSWNNPPSGTLLPVSIPVTQGHDPMKVSPHRTRILLKAGVLSDPARRGNHPKITCAIAIIARCRHRREAIVVFIVLPFWLMNHGGIVLFLRAEFRSSR